VGYRGTVFQNLKDFYLIHTQKHKIISYNKISILLLEIDAADKDTAVVLLGRIAVLRIDAAYCYRHFNRMRKNG